MDYCEVPLDGAVLAQSLADATAIRALERQGDDGARDPEAARGREPPRCAVAVLLQGSDSDDEGAHVVSRASPAAAATAADRAVLCDLTEVRGGATAGCAVSVRGGNEGAAAASAPGVGLKYHDSEPGSAGSGGHPGMTSSDVGRDAVAAAPGEGPAGVSGSGVGAQTPDGGSEGVDGGPDGDILAEC